jgi:hypothetical protein
MQSFFQVAAEPVRHVDAGAGESAQRHAHLAARRGEQETVAQDLARHAIRHVQALLLQRQPPRHHPASR